MGKYNRRDRLFCYMCEDDNNIRERQLFHYQSLDITEYYSDQRYHQPPVQRLLLHIL